MDVSGILALSPIVITVISGIAIIIYFSKKAAPVEQSSDKAGKFVSLKIELHINMCFKIMSFTKFDM